MLEKLCRSTIVIVSFTAAKVLLEGSSDSTRLCLDIFQMCIGHFLLCTLHKLMIGTRDSSLRALATHPDPIWNEGTIDSWSSIKSDKICPICKLQWHCWFGFKSSALKYNFLPYTVDVILGFWDILDFKYCYF